MAEDRTYRGMTNVPRGVYGARSIASLVPVIARTAFKRAAPGVAPLMEAWEGIVGPVLAAETAPLRLAQGTLTIACSGPMAMELQHLSAELLQRIAQYLGAPTVRRLRFVQSTPRRLATPMRRIPPAADDLAAAEAMIDLPGGPLRSALASLGRAVLSEPSSRLGKQPRTRY
jgi:hypothetical protein